MSVDLGYCLSCAVHHGSRRKVEYYLDSHGLTDWQAMCMARYLLRKAAGNRLVLKNFLLEYAIEANSESNSKSEMPLYWNGNVLYDAVGPNSIQIMRSLRQVRHSNNWFGEPRLRNGFDLLQMAVPLDNTGIAKVLLDHLYRNSSQPRSCGTINNLQTIKSLLHATGDIKSELETAIQLAKQEIYKVVWNPLYFNETPLYAAAAIGNSFTMKNLLEKNADVEERSYDDMTPIHISAQLGHIQCVKTLLNHKADINSLCALILGKLLYKTITSLNGGLFELLLRKWDNVDIKKKDKYKMDHTNMLDFIIDTGRIELIEVILKIDADPGSPLAETQSKILKNLLQYDFPVIVRPADTGLLYMAICRGCPTIVKYLLDRGTKCNDKVENDGTPLHTAVAYRRIEIARLLIKNHADVNARDGVGNTPLHILDRRSSIDIDSTFGNKHHSAPVDAATFEEYKELVELLLEHKADVNSINDEKETPLHSAASYGNYVVIKLLLENGAMINAKKTDGMTALHLAARYGRRLPVNLLIDHGADINLLSNDGKTPLDCATSYDVTGELRSRIIKIIVLNRWVCDRNLQALHLLDASSPWNYNRRRSECCLLEVECMRQKTIGVSNVSYYDVLTMSMNQLVHYARNKHIVRAMEKGRHKRMFPLYSSMLCHRFKNGKERAGGLMDSSMESFRFLTGYHLPDLTITVLFDYLSNEDLKNLIKATRAMISTRQTEH